MTTRMGRNKRVRGVLFGVWMSVLFSGCGMSALDLKGCEFSLAKPVTSNGGGYHFESAKPAGKVGEDGQPRTDAVGMSKDAKELAVGETFFLEGLAHIQAPQAAEQTPPVLRLESSDPTVLRVEWSKRPMCCAVNEGRANACFVLSSDAEIADCANGQYNERFGLHEVGAVFYRYDARLDALRLGEAHLVLWEGEEGVAVEKDRFTFHISPHDWIQRGSLGALGFVRYGVLAEREVEFEGKDGKKRERMGILVAGDNYTLERAASLLGDSDLMGAAIVEFHSDRQAVVGVESEKVRLCCPKAAESSASCREMHNQEAMASCKADVETALLAVYRVKLTGRTAGPAWIVQSRQGSSVGVERRALSFEDPKELSLSVRVSGSWNVVSDDGKGAVIDQPGMILIPQAGVDSPLVSLSARIEHVRYESLHPLQGVEWSVTPSESASVSSSFLSTTALMVVKKADLLEIKVAISSQISRHFTIDMRSFRKP